MKKNTIIILVSAVLTLAGFAAPFLFGQDQKPQVTVSATAAPTVQAAPQESAVAGTDAKTQSAPAQAEPDKKAKTEPAAGTETQEEAKSANRFTKTIWALVPPLLAILLALITKEVYSSLFIGIVLGGCFVADFSPLKVVDAVVTTGLIEAIKATSGIFIFLVILGIFVALINKTGATAAFGRWTQTHVKSRPGAILATFLLGIMIFIDDYFNCLTVGSVMLPVTDAKRISRAKLAYIIDSTAAPICMIAPVSSWAAAVSQYVDVPQYSGLEMFIRAIPYNFYSLLTFVFIIGITLLRVDFGPMAVHERNAIEKGDLFTTGKEVDNGITTAENPKGRVTDMLIPIILLIGVCVFALVYIGGIFDGKSFITAFSETNASVALPWGGLVVLVLTIIYLVQRRVISAKDAMECVPKGFCAMVPAIMILTFAVSLKNMTGELQAKEYIELLMRNEAMAHLDVFLPAVIFLVACALGFSTGTSWGTFGILLPIVTGIFDPSSPLMFIGMSACLAGAVCGDHCSPISDTTIMSSAGARCEHMTHVTTQLPYAITVAAVSFISFILAGLIQNWYIVFPIAVVLMIGLLVFAKLITRKAVRPE